MFLFHAWKENREFTGERTRPNRKIGAFEDRREMKDEKSENKRTDEATMKKG